MRTSDKLPEECREEIRKALIAYCRQRIASLRMEQDKLIRRAPRDRREMMRRQLRGRILELTNLKVKLEQDGLARILYEVLGDDGK